MTTPAPSSTLAGPSVTFSWTAGTGATGYALWIGSTGPGSNNLYYSGQKASTVTSLAVSGLPVNGETIYVRLITYYGSSNAYINYTYTSATGAAMKTPAPGSTLAGSSVTFTWTAGTGATGYALWAGTTGTGTGADNLYYSGEKSSSVTSLAVSGLPVNGGGNPRAFDYLLRRQRQRVHQLHLHGGDGGGADDANAWQHAGGFQRHAWLECCVLTRLVMLFGPAPRERDRDLTIFTTPAKRRRQSLH